jgi:hypothetical protein
MKPVLQLLKSVFMRQEIPPLLENDVPANRDRHCDRARPCTEKCVLNLAISVCRVRDRDLDVAAIGVTTGLHSSKAS